MNRVSLVKNASVTEITDAKWKPKVSSEWPAPRSLAEKAIKTSDTAVIRKQKAMLPAVSIRAFPAGNFRGSTRWTALWQRRSVRFDIGSKMASAMVVRRDNDPDAMAP